MKIATKWILSIILVVSLAFSVGGTALITYNFQMALEEKVAQSTSRHTLTRYTIESKLINDQLNNEAFQTSTLGSYVKQLISYVKGESLHLMLENGTIVFSNIKLKDPSLEDGYYAILENEDNYTLYLQSGVSAAGEKIQMISGYDISDIYRQREEQYHMLLWIEAVVVLGTTLIAWFLSRAITKPIRKLSRVSEQIAEGSYNLRTEIKSKDEIGQFSKNFDTMVDTLQEEMEKRTSFVADFSHELKTPMTSMIGYADILRSQALQEDEKYRYANAIYKNSKRLETLATKMMEMLALSENKVELTKVKMAGMQKKLALLFAENEHIYYSIEANEVMAEPELLLTLLRNLIENACKASGEKEVKVIGNKEQGKYIFSIIDEGIGMTPEQIAHATEPFYKADRSRSQGGAGIGLAICKTICEIHHTELLMESELGIGTKVSFGLEVCDE